MTASELEMLFYLNGHLLKVVDHKWAFHDLGIYLTQRNNKWYYGIVYVNSPDYTVQEFMTVQGDGEVFSIRSSEVVNGIVQVFRIRSDSKFTYEIEKSLKEVLK